MAAPMISRLKVTPGKLNQYCNKIPFLRNNICNKHILKLLYHSLSVDTGGEQRLNLEVGKLARFADGSVVATCGDTAVLVAVSGKGEANPGAQFLPLTVDFRQKAAAAGRIPTNHLRRDLGPSDREILISRVIDRSLRAKFPDNYFCETQVTCNVLSIDGVNDPDVISINGASAALAASVLPWNGPVGAVRVGFTSQQDFIINPTRRQQQLGLGSVIVTSDEHENVLMLEGETNIVDYVAFMNGIVEGTRNAANIAKEIGQLTSSRKRSYVVTQDGPSRELLQEVESLHSEKVAAILTDSSHDKISRDTALKNARYSTLSKLQENPNLGVPPQKLHDAVNIVEKKLIRQQILDSTKRCDGRLLEEVRPISSSVGVYAPLHGSALFQRGQTQVLCTLTFDSLQAALKADPISVMTGAMKEKNFMLHYEFPAYATNEVRSPGIKNRRELGHGSLAEKGLRPIIPNDFPFSIRLSAEVLESNGSSSMASICAGCLALMDAGVQIKEPAAGVAMGLVSDITERQKKYTVLTDILGLEDYFGDMDLKVGGTKSGITTIQMDLKIPGIPLAVLKHAISQSQAGISHVLDRMMETSGLDRPRPTIKPNGPVRETVTVLPARRAAFLGPGGHNIRKIQYDIGVTLTALDETTYEVFAPNTEAMEEAMEAINALLQAKKEPELEFNAVYESKIVEIRESGVLVQLHPAMDPVFLPNRQLDHRQVQHASALGLEVGQMIQVKYYGRDPATGHHRVSRKAIQAMSTKSYQYMDTENEKSGRKKRKP